MSRPRKSGLVALALAVAGASAAAPAARADDASAPAREWRSYCKAYMAALEGGGSDAKAASDLDLTYCLGVTKGLLTGLRVGAQIGALSFGSKLSVQYKLDRDEVFKQFEGQDPNRLLGICAPAAALMPDYVRPVLDKLEKTPADADRPIAEVFYEALSEAYPCR